MITSKLRESVSESADFLSACVLALFRRRQFTKFRAAEEVVLLLFNGNVYTVNEKNSRRPKRSRRRKTGSCSLARMRPAKKFSRRGARSICTDYTCPRPDRFALSHNFRNRGERELTLNLEGTTTLEIYLAKSESAVAQTPRDQVIHWSRLDRNFLETAAISDTDKTDKIAPDNPFFSLARRPRRIATSRQLNLQD